MRIPQYRPRDNSRIGICIASNVWIGCWQLLLTSTEFFSYFSIFVSNGSDEVQELHKAIYICTKIAENPFDSLFTALSITLLHLNFCIFVAGAVVRTRHLNHYLTTVVNLFLECLTYIIIHSIDASILSELLLPLTDLNNTKLRIRRTHNENRIKI